MFDLIEILYKIIIVKKTISIDILNSRLKHFNFGSHNKPPLLNLDNLKAKKIKLSFLECRSLILSGGLLFGDLISKTNKYWKLYIVLRKILQIILSPYVTETKCNTLENLIEKHHNMYLTLFNLNLKPKHHFLVHYPHILRKIGPVVGLSTLRYEAKHRQSKVCANTVSSRVNITKTLAIKHQLNFSNRLVRQIGFKDQKQFDMKINKTPTDIGSNLKEICDRDKVLFDNFKNSHIISKYQHENRIYKQGQFICTSFDDDSLPMFASIKHILINSKDEIYFLCESFETLNFNEHFFAYEILETKYETLTLLEKVVSIPQMFQNTFPINVKHTL